MCVELVSAKADGRAIVENLFRYYIYDMSVFMGWKISTSGAYEDDPSFLDEYWSNPNSHPYLIKHNNEIAGFSLLRRYPRSETIHDIGQFFILGKFNGQGVGREAFKKSVSLYPGKWVTRVLMENKSALKFWLKVIAEQTEGKYTHTTENYDDLPMHFIRYDVAGS